VQPLSSLQTISNCEFFFTIITEKINDAMWVLVTWEALCLYKYVKVYVYEQWPEMYLIETMS